MIVGGRARRIDRRAGSDQQRIRKEQVLTRDGLLRQRARERQGRRRVLIRVRHQLRGRVQRAVLAMYWSRQSASTSGDTLWRFWTGNARLIRSRLTEAL